MEYLPLAMASQIGQKQDGALGAGYDEQSPVSKASAIDNGSDDAIIHNRGSLSDKERLNGPSANGEHAARGEGDVDVHAFDHPASYKE